MQDRSARGLGWLAMHVVFFPLLVMLLRGWHRVHEALQAADLAPPAWLRNAITFGLFASLYMGLAYAVAALLNRRYPHTPVESASWEDAPRHRPDRSPPPRGSGPADSAR